MRTPDVADETILAIIGALRAQHRRVPARLVRQELRALYQRAAGTDRIYRLMAEADRGASIPAAADALATLRAEHEAALAREARLREQFDRAQEQWALDIDRVRLQLREARGALPAATRQADKVLQLARELKAAHQRIAELEGRAAPRGD